MSPPHDGAPRLGTEGRGAVKRTIETDSHSHTPSAETPDLGPFARYADAIQRSGLGDPLPVPFGNKTPPPDDYTGANGLRPSGPDLEEWRAHKGGCNVAIRLAQNVAGIDRDLYDGKPGAATIADFEAEHGALPATWSLTSRYDGSRIGLYRLPEGADESALRDMGPGVEVLHASRRYAMGPGSLHPEGRKYRILNPEGNETDVLPHKDELPVLTHEQVAGLSAVKAPTASAEPVDVSVITDAPQEVQDHMREVYVPRSLEGLRNEVAETVAMAKGAPNADGETWENDGKAGLVAGLLCRAAQFDMTCEALGMKADHVDHVVAAFTKAGYKALVESKVSRNREKARERGPALPKDWHGKVKSARGVERFSAPRSAPDLVDEGEVAESDTFALLGGRKMTDANLVDVFAIRYVDRLRYDWQSKRWLYWDGTRWRPVDEHRVVGLSTVFAQDFVADVAKQGDADTTKAASGRQQKARIDAIVHLAKGHGLLRVDPEQLDAHPYLLNVANGVVDLRTGDLGPHDPSLLMTRITPTRYVPGATHPDLETVLGDLDPDVADFLEVALGQSAIGNPPEDDVATFLHGQGANSKSTILVAAIKALGDQDGYAVLVSERALLDVGKGDRHPTELADFRGARLAVLEELPNRGELSMERLKKITGETMEARRIRADPIRWSITHSLFVTSNYRPRVKETDHGSWRRVRMIDFPLKYVRTPQELGAPNVRLGDIHLRSRLQKAKGQQEAVLAWIVAGAQRYIEAGEVMPAEPQAIADATKAWRDSCDPLGRFLSEHVEAEYGWCIPSADLYQRFKNTLVTEGHAPWSEQTFSERMNTQPLATSGKATKGRPKVTEGEHVSRPRVSHHPDDALVTHTYKEGQQVSAWVGLKWLPSTPDEGGQK